MGFFDNLFSKGIEEPVFVKEYDSESNMQLNQLNSLLEKVGDDQKSIIEDEIKKIQIGLIGEKNVAYELKNSFLLIVCLHDIRLEYKDFCAQFDFIVIAKKCIFVLETKLLTGDIIVDNMGNFIRVFKDYKGNVYKKEGINSPISQNEKHVEILKRFLKDKNQYKNIPITSIVIIANPKSIIDLKYARKDVKELIIKHDQIKNKILYFTRALHNSPYSLSDKAMINLADLLVENDHHIEYDYIKRFNLKIDTATDGINIEADKPDEKVLNDSIYEGLKKFRFEKAKEKEVPLWFLFNNQQLEALVLNKPKNKEEFISISGFGEKKFEDFGEDIINILWDNKVENQANNQGIKQVDSIGNEDVGDMGNTTLYKALRKFRYDQSQIDNVKHYV